MTAPVAVPNRLLLALAIAVWLASFAVLRVHGTWLQFAIGGVVLAALALASDAGARSLLRPSGHHVAIGLLLGASMVALTHLLFALATALAPELRAATAWLLRLSYAGGAITDPARASLIVVIAACEEVVFRGAPLRALPAGDRRALRPLGRRDIVRIVATSAAYAGCMLTLGSALLVACAFACGLLWACLRVVTRSLPAAIVAHVTWDLGVLIVWPLLPPGS